MKNTGRINLYSGKNTISAWLAWNAQLSYLHHNKTELGVQHGFAIVTFRSSDTSTFLQPSNPKPFSMIHFLKNKHLANTSRTYPSWQTTKVQVNHNHVKKYLWFWVMHVYSLLKGYPMDFNVQMLHIVPGTQCILRIWGGIQLTLSPTFSSSMRVTLRIIDLLKLFHGTITICGLRIQLC